MNKNTCYLLLTVSTVFMLAACNNGHSKKTAGLEESRLSEVTSLSDVSMKADIESVSPTGLTLLFENNSEVDLIYGEDLLLEEAVEDRWYEVPTTISGEYAYEDIGYEVEPGEEASMAIDWEWLYGDLDEGYYRIAKRVLHSRETGDFDEYVLTAEFKIE